MKRCISILKNSFILISCIFLFLHISIYATPEDASVPTTNDTKQEDEGQNNEDSFIIESTAKEEKLSSNEPIENASTEKKEDSNKISEEKIFSKEASSTIESTSSTIVSNGKEIENEKAIEGSAPLFPSKKEIEKNTSLLTCIEVLKELEEAQILFLNTPSLISKKEEINREAEVPKNEEKNATALHTTEIAEEIRNEEVEKIESNNIEEDNSFDDEDFFIDDFDREMESQIEESYVDNEAEFLTFDEEQKREKKIINNSHTENIASSKQEDIEGTEQLSTVIDEDDKVNISRYANILKGQSIDFSYPGEGWVYLGEENTKKGMEYQMRKMNGGKTFFNFRANEEGNYILNFSYFDVFSGDFIVDAVSVKVMANNDGIKKAPLVLEYQKKDEKIAETSKKTHFEVGIDGDKVGIKIEENIEKKTQNEPPKATSKVALKKDVKEDFSKKIEKNKESIQSPKLPQKKEENPYKEPQVFVNIASLTPENAKGNEEQAANTIQEAEDAISKGDAKVALEKIENFFNISSNNIDLAYLLRGKAYELNGNLRNVKLALNAYKFLVKTFPNSAHYDDARRRIRYIEKYFVNIK